MKRHDPLDFEKVLRADMGHNPDPLAGSINNVLGHASQKLTNAGDKGSTKGILNGVDLYVDIETTGLRQNFAKQQMDVGLVQIAMLNATTGQTFDMRTSLGMEMFRRYREGRYGEGVEGARKFLIDITNAEKMGGTPYQKGIFSLKHPNMPQALDENVVAGVFRRQIEVWDEAIKKEVPKDKSLAFAARSGLAGARHVGLTDVEALYEVKKVLDEGARIQGWNFSYDVGQMMDSAQRLGLKDVNDTFSRAIREGRVRDIGEDFFDFLHAAHYQSHAGSDRDLNFNLSLFHRSKESKEIPLSELRRHERDIRRRIATGDAFKTPPSYFSDPDIKRQRVLELQPGFEAWLRNGPGGSTSVRQDLIEYYAAGGLMDQASAQAKVDKMLGKYSDFRSLSYHLAIDDPGAAKVLSQAVEKTRASDFKLMLDQTFRRGKSTPDMRYVGLWSLGPITKALGIDPQEGWDATVGGQLRKASQELHDAAVDNLAAKRVHNLVQAFQDGEKSVRERFLSFESHLREHFPEYGKRAGGETFGATRLFLNRLQQFSELSAVQKAMEPHIGNMAGLDRAAEALHAYGYNIGAKGQGMAAQRTNSSFAASAQDFFGRLRTEPAKALSNWVSESMQTGKGRLTLGAVGLALFSGVYSMMEPEGRSAAPELGEPRLTAEQIRGMPATVRGDYLHGLVQAELMRRGQVSGIEVPIQDAEGRGFIDAMDAAGYPIEIKTSSTVYGPKAAHANQLQRYIQATGAGHGQLYYVDYESGPGVIRSFNIPGLRNPKSRYNNEFGIYPSEMQLSNVSDYRSGRSWYHSLETALRLKAYRPDHDIAAHQHVRASISWIKSASEFKLDAAGGFARPLASNVRAADQYIQRAPIQHRHRLLAPVHDITPQFPTDRRGTVEREFVKRLKGALTPPVDTVGMKTRGEYLPLDTSASTWRKNLFTPLSEVRTYHDVKAIRLRGTDTHMPVALPGRGTSPPQFSILRAPAAPTPTHAADWMVYGQRYRPQAIKPDVSGTSWSLEAGRKMVPYHLDNLSYVARQGMDYNVGSFRPYRGLKSGVERYHPNNTRPAFRSQFVHWDIPVHPGIKGKDTSMIEGIRQGQFENKWPFGSGSDPRDMQANDNTNLYLGLMVGQIYASMIDEVSVYRLGGTWVDDNVNDMFKQLTHKYRMPQHKAVQLMKQAGLDVAHMEGGMKHQGFVHGFKQGFVKNGAPPDKSFLGRIRAAFKGWRGSMEEAEDFRKGVDAVAKSSKGSGAATQYQGMWNRLKSRTDWLTRNLDGTKAKGLFKNIRNFFVNTTFLGLGWENDPYLQSAADDLASTAKSSHAKVTKDFSRAQFDEAGNVQSNLAAYTKRTETVFGSKKLGSIKNNWAQHFDDKADDLAKRLAAVDVKFGASPAAQARGAAKIGAARAAEIKSLKRAIGRNRTLARGLGRMSGGSLITAAFSLIEWNTSRKRRAEEMGGGVRAQIIASAAATAETGGMLAGAIYGGKLGLAAGAAIGSFIPVVGTTIGAGIGWIAGTLIGGVVGAMAGTFVGDIMQDIGKAVFGLKAKDPSNDYFRLAMNDPYRDIYRSQYIQPGMGRALDNVYTDSWMDPNGLNLSDFGSPYSPPMAVRQHANFAVSPQVTKKVAPQRPQVVQNIRNRTRERHKIRDQRTRLRGHNRVEEPANPGWNASRAGYRTAVAHS